MTSLSLITQENQWEFQNKKLLNTIEVFKIGIQDAIYSNLTISFLDMKKSMRFFLCGVELSLSSVNSENLRNH